MGHFIKMGQFIFVEKKFAYVVKYFVRNKKHSWLETKNRETGFERPVSGTNSVWPVLDVLFQMISNPDFVLLTPN